MAITATAEDGRTIVGVGESDANPWIMRECVNTFGTHVVGLGIKQMRMTSHQIWPLFRHVFTKVREEFGVDVADKSGDFMAVLGENALEVRALGGPCSFKLRFH